MVGATTTLVRADARPVPENQGELHPQLKAQLRELRLRTGSADPDVPMLLRLINEHYQTIERERRGIVESMRLMADEAQALAHEAREQSSEHLQVILDHIKDVVLLVDAEGLIRTFNPTGERVFGYTAGRGARQAHRPAHPEDRRRREHRARRWSAWRPASMTPRSTWPRASCGRSARTAACSRRRSPSARHRVSQRADVRAVPARCDRAARVRAGHARERRALPAAGGPRPGCDRGARCRHRPLRRCQRQGAEVLRPQPREAAHGRPAHDEPGAAARRRHLRGARARLHRAGPGRRDCRCSSGRTWTAPAARSSARCAW